MFWWRHQLNGSFFDKYGLIFELSLKNFAFFTHFMKNYAIVEIGTKKKLWHWIDKYADLS